MTTKTLRYYLNKDMIPMSPMPTKLYLNYKNFKDVDP